jgi:hypothetical protein
MNKERFDKIIQYVMNNEIECDKLLNHLNHHQSETLDDEIVEADFTNPSKKV